jgi:PKD repeat protein
MATLYIYPNQVQGYSYCGPYGGTGAGILGDLNNATGFANTYGTTAASVTVYSDATMPSGFVGATINSVSVTYSITSNLQRGTAYVGITRSGYSTNSGTLGPGFSAGSQAISRPGGGSWVYTDFYTSSLLWYWVWNGDADDHTKTCLLEELYLTIDYTPVSTPTAEFTVSTTTGTSPLSVTFTDQSTNTPTSWSWSFGDSNTSTSQNPVHIYSTTATSTYTVTLTATNAGGTDTETKSSLITVDPAAVAVAAEFSASPLTGVQNLAVQFTDGSTGTPAPTSWLWSFGDSSTSTAQNPTHTYTTIGTYTVILTVENTTPTTDTETKTSYITVANGKPVPAFTASTTTGTRPLTVDFTGTATNALPTSWDWDFGDGTGSVAQSPTHVYTTVGTFSPVLTVGNAIGTASTTVMTLAGTSDTYTQVVVNFATITASFTAAPLMGYIPLTTRFTDQSSGDANSWAWSFGDGETSSEQHPVHVYYTNAGAATVTVTGTGFSDDYDLRHGLTNYWKMEEGTGTGARTDFIGSANLTPTASCTQVAGKNDYGVQIPTGQNLYKDTGFTHSGAWSYAAWVKFSSVAVAGAELFGVFGGGGTYAGVGKDNAIPYLLYNGTAVEYGSSTLTTDTWYHFVLTFNGTSVFKLYLNGALEASLTASAPTATGFALYGGGGGGTTSYDEVGRYGLELDQDQISGLYNSGAGEFFDVVQTSDSQNLSEICPILPDKTWGYFFEETKYMMMEPVHSQDVCEGFDNFGGMSKAVELAQKRLQRFVLETAALRKEATLSSADTDTENFALPTDLIELLRVEVDGSTYYPADHFQEDMDTTALNTYFQRDALSITIPGTFGSTPTVKVLYTYVPDAPSVPAPCTCPTPPATGPWGAFPLPYVLWWVIRYGLMADFFAQAGERNDPLRAAQCEKMFTFGVELYKLLYRGSM